MSRKALAIGVILTLALGGGLVYRFTHLTTGGAGEHAEHREAAHGGAKEKEAHGEPGGHEKHEEHEEAKSVTLTPQAQRQYGVVLAQAKKERLAGVISATGKVEVNGDRIVHVAPRIAGRITAVRASLGDSVASGQVLVLLDSVELGEAMNRYRQSKSRLVLAKSNLERVKALVEKKIAARKEILQAETEYQNALGEQQTDRERLLLYGLSAAELEGKKPLLPVGSPMAGIITEKQAVVGELADPGKSLYTVADLSTVWVMADIHEKELARVHRGQQAAVTVSAFPELKFHGKVSHIADQVDPATRTVKARVEVGNPGRKLKPEMFASVNLALPADTPAVLALPEEALQELAGQRVVFVSADGKEFLPRPLELGRSVGGKVEVLAGMEAGELYAAKGSFLLKAELKKGELGGHGH